MKNLGSPKTKVSKSGDTFQVTERSKGQEMMPPLPLLSIWTMEEGRTSHRTTQGFYNKFQN